MLKRIAPMLLAAMGFLLVGAGALAWITPTQAAPNRTPLLVGDVAPQGTLSTTGSITDGAYIVRLALGCGCHFNPPLGGLAGGDDFSSPDYGALFARNITPHPETGIGAYTPEELETVLRTGKQRNGEQLFPVMPYQLFSRIAEDDMDDLIAFLLEGQEPISNTVPPRNLLFEPAPFTPTVAPPPTAPISGVARGEYIVNVLGACADCHGPNLAGTPGFAPNITSDPAYGIGLLSTGELSVTLHTGVRPVITDSQRFDGSPVGSIMALIIQTAISNWRPDDATAVAEYLKTVAAVGNQPPLFVSPPNRTTEVGASYAYTAEIADIDVFDMLTITAPALPEWLTLGPTNVSQRPVTGAAVLAGTATISDVGVHPVTLAVTDNAGATTTSTFSITVSVTGVNLPYISVEEVDGDPE